MELKATRKLADDLTDIAGSIEKFYFMDSSVSKINEPVQKIETLIEYLRQIRPQGDAGMKGGSEREAKINEIRRLQREFGDRARRIKEVQERLMGVQEKIAVFNRI